MNLAFAKVGILSYVYLALICLLLASCAASNVSRDTASNVDLGVRNAKNLFGSAVNGDISETYQNASSTAKGAVIGGLTGALVGTVSTGVGVGLGTLTGAIVGATYGAYIDSFTTLEDALTNRGGQIIILGDQIMIVLPSARIFEYMTATIKGEAFSTLAMVGRYINRFVKTSVKVAVYTNDTGARPLDLALSQQQAESVAKFLLASGVNSRLLYAVGCGGTNLVVNTGLQWDGSDNYRIEITFEKLFV